MAVPRSEGRERKPLSTAARVTLVVLALMVVGVGTCVGLVMHSFSHYGEVPADQVTYFVYTDPVDEHVGLDTHVDLMWVDNRGEQQELDEEPTPWSQTYDGFEDGAALFLRADNVDGESVTCEIIVGGSIQYSDRGWSDCTAQGTLRLGS